MKKVMCLLLVIVTVASVMTGCHLNLSSSGITGEAEPIVSQMLTALSENDMETAASLLHPDADDAGLSDIAAYLNGRTVTKFIQNGISVRAQMAGTGGKMRTEEGSMTLTLSDGKQIGLTYVYYTNSEGSGFTAFRMSIGV